MSVLVNRLRQAGKFPILGVAMALASLVATAPAVVPAHAFGPTVCYSCTSINPQSTTSSS
jgi:hypothetical protein